MAALMQQSCRLISYLNKSLLFNHTRCLALSADLSSLSVCPFSTSTRHFQEDEESSQKKAEPESRKVVDVETSIRYIRSKAYQTTYKDEPVWTKYRRNHKGGIPPSKTRKTCIRAGFVSTGSPCPICRDEYLVVDSKNLNLLKQFVSPETGEVLHYSKTGVCQKQYKKLLVSVQEAWDKGYLDKPIPFRKYDYSHYYPHLKNRSTTSDQQ